MDITNIPQNLLKGLEQKNNDQLLALSRVLNVVLGKTIIATVVSTAPISPQEREALLKQTAAALVDIKQNANHKITPALKTEMSRLLEQQNLIKSPELKWVNLVVNNRPLLVYSDKPLIAGQSIPVQLQNLQKLVMLDSSALDPAKLIAANTAGKPINSQAMQAATSLLSTAQAITTPSTRAQALNANTSADLVKDSARLNELLKIALANLTILPTDSAPNAKLNQLMNLAKSVLATANANQPQPTTTNASAQSNAPTAAVRDLNSATLPMPNNASLSTSLANSSTNPLTNLSTNLSTTGKAASNTMTNGTEQTPLAKNISQSPLNQATVTDTAPAPKTPLVSAHEVSSKYVATTPDNKHNNAEITNTKNIIGDNLRNLLPHRDSPNLLLSAITQLQTMPSSSRLQLLSPNLEQALKSVAEKIRAPDQLAQPKTLAQTFKNSGIFFESKLAQTAQANALSHTGTSTSTSTSTNKDLPSNNAITIKNAFTQDVKGSLLTLLSRVSQEISGDSKPPSSEQILKLLPQLNGLGFFNPSGALHPNASSLKNDIAQAIGLFMQELMHKPVKELSNKELRTQLLLLLQQQTVHSLAKIQLQQLHSLHHEVDTKDSSAPNASWQVDIPIKQHNEIHQLHLRIEREWLDEENDNEQQKKTEKVKQWSVTLRFDLPSLGEFSAQLKIINTQVSATLWAAQENTFGQVKQQLDNLRKQLEHEGIEVKYLHCMRGTPPEKPMALGYSLIDIST